MNDTHAPRLARIATLCLLVLAMLAMSAVLFACGSKAATQPTQSSEPQATQPTEPQATPPATAETGKLVIKDVKVGTGPAAKKGDNLVVDYTGYLTDGTKFDSSVGKQPFPFQLGAGSVIPGWDQGLVGMKVGGERKLTIPPDLAYGDQGAGGVIPPGATLVFDVKLLKIQ